MAILRLPCQERTAVASSVRIFGLSVVVTIVSLVVGFLYGGWNALFLLVILGILEVSLSFDNAVINATILQRMSQFWQTIFLTIGILIAVFGMRLIFPLLIVYFASGLGPFEALDLALNPPPDGALTFPNGDPSYELLITEAHPQIAAFGGVFLLMLFLDFIFEDRDIKWLHWIEEPLAKIGRLDQLSVVVAIIILVVAATQLAEPEKLSTVLLSGALGLLTYLVVNGLGNLFHVPGEDDEDEDGDDDPHLEERSKRLAGSPQAEDVLATQDAKAERSGGPSDLAKATGKAGFFLFLYLEVLDATFSFDGVIGAFAITSDPIIIALGLGFIGAMFVRSITIYLVRKGTLSEYVYLEHGAHWAIGALAIILVISVGTIHISEIITGLVGVVLIGLAYMSSVIRNRREAAEESEPDAVEA